MGLGMTRDGQAVVGLVSLLHNESDPYLFSYPWLSIPVAQGTPNAHQTLSHDSFINKHIPPWVHHRHPLSGSG